MPMKISSTARVQDMTSGDPIRLILSFAIPLFIGNIFQQFYNMVDTMVVGYTLGDSAIIAHLDQDPQAAAEAIVWAVEDRKVPGQDNATIVIVGVK